MADVCQKWSQKAGRVWSRDKEQTPLDLTHLGCTPAESPWAAVINATLRENTAHAYGHLLPGPDYRKWRWLYYCQNRRLVHFCFFVDRECLHLMGICLADVLVMNGFDIFLSLYGMNDPNEDWITSLIIAFILCSQPDLMLPPHPCDWPSSPSLSMPRFLHLKYQDENTNLLG